MSLNVEVLSLIKTNTFSFPEQTSLHSPRMESFVADNDPSLPVFEHREMDANNQVQVDVKDGQFLFCTKDETSVIKFIPDSQVANVFLLCQVEQGKGVTALWSTDLLKKPSLPIELTAYKKVIDEEDNPLVVLRCQKTNGKKVDYRLESTNLADGLRYNVMIGSLNTGQPENGAATSFSPRSTGFYL